MVCMLVLVSSKAHSTARGLSAVTRLHSISRFSLEGWRRKGGGDRRSAGRPLQTVDQASVCACPRALCGRTERCVPVSVVLFKGWEGGQRVIELRGEGPELTERHTHSSLNNNPPQMRSNVPVLLLSALPLATS